MTRPKIWLQAAPQFISDLMKDFHLTPEQASGFPGNAAIESSFFTDIIEDGAKAKGQLGGHGWFQWTGMSDRNPRRREFERWLRRTSNLGYRADNYFGNYSMLYRELKGSEGRRVLPKLRLCTTPEQAARVVCMEYERPADPQATMAKRQAAAREAFSLWQQNPPQPTVWPTDKPQEPATMPTQPATPIPTPVLPPPSGAVLPDPKPASQSKTLITIVATITGGWLAKKGLLVPPGWEDVVSETIFTVGPLIAGMFHFLTNAPTQGSPLAKVLDLSKQLNNENRVEINKMFEDQAATQQPVNEAWVTPSPLPDAVEYPTTLMERFRTAQVWEILEHGPEIMRCLALLLGDRATNVYSPPAQLENEKSSITTTG
jgi:Phage tail lysozyme